MGNQESSLHQAAAHNDVEKIEWLFAHENANVNDRDKVSLGKTLACPESTAWSITRLRKEALREHHNSSSARMKTLLQDGWVPVHFASYGGALEATQALLLRGSNPAAADKVTSPPSIPLSTPQFALPFLNPSERTILDNKAGHDPAQASIPAVGGGRDRASAFCL